MIAAGIFIFPFRHSDRLGVRWELERVLGSCDTDHLFCPCHSNSKSSLKVSTELL